MHAWQCFNEITHSELEGCVPSDWLSGVPIKFMHAQSQLSTSNYLKAMLSTVSMHAWAATHRQWSVSLTDSTHMHPRIHPTSHRMSLISLGVVCQSSSSGVAFLHQGIQSIDPTRQVNRSSS
jgi:hypothetical protein